LKQRLHPALSLFINSVAAYKAVALNVRGEVVPSTSLSLRDALRWGQDRPCKTLSLIVHPHAIISVVPIIDSALNHTRTSGFPPARGEGVSPLCAEAGAASNKGRMPSPRNKGGTPSPRKNLIFWAFTEHFFCFIIPFWPMKCGGGRFAGIVLREVSHVRQEIVIGL